MWFCRLTTFEDLCFDQDYFISWQPPKHLGDIGITDHEKQNNGFSTEDDITKICSRQLHFTPFHSNDSEWIRNCLKRAEREEFQTKALVICAAFYPKSEKGTYINDYNETVIRHSGVKECDA